MNIFHEAHEAHEVIKSRFDLFFKFFVYFVAFVVQKVLTPSCPSSFQNSEFIVHSRIRAQHKYNATEFGFIQ
jgi:hypothetical protein